MDFLRRIFTNKPADEADRPTNDATLPVVQENGTAADTPYMADPNDAAATNPVRYTAGVTRPLPPDPSPYYQPQGGHILFAQASDQGMVRANNQDAALSFFFTSDSEDERPDFGLFIVADGMGGHQLGEKASALTTRVVASQIIQKVYVPILDGTDTNDADRPTIPEALTAAVKLANDKVMKHVPEGGTTVTAVVVIGNMAHFAHVGDSRAYLISKNEVEQITRDHSLVQRLIELGQLTVEESMEHPQRNVLYRAIGQQPDLDVDTITRRLPPASHILLCSDGLWGWVSEKEMVDIISTAADLQDACNRLIALANTHGGHDNITAVLFKLPGS
jgi:serine/threonine protein phosphatase PrpC